MSCGVIKTNLVECVFKSNCYLRSDPPKSASECLKTPAELPEECQHLRKAFFECKRGMLDMRKRFRGLDPGQGRPGARSGADKPPADEE